MNKKNAKNQTNTKMSAASAPTSPIVTYLKNACCFYAVISLLLLVFTYGFILSSQKPNAGVYPLHYILLFPLSLCLSAAGIVRRSHLSRATRYTLHPLLTVGSIYLFGYLPYQIANGTRAAMVFIMICLMLAVYGVCVGVAALILRSRSIKKAEAVPYKSQFSDIHRP